MRKADYEKLLKFVKNLARTGYIVDMQYSLGFLNLDGISAYAKLCDKSSGFYSFYIYYKREWVEYLKELEIEVEEYGDSSNKSKDVCIKFHVNVEFGESDERKY